jgi:hypothetical protein
MEGKNWEEQKWVVRGKESVIRASKITAYIK